MFAKVANWFKPIPDAKPLTDEQEIKRLYRSWRIKMFFSMYFGYALFYFTRKNLDIIKPVLIENNLFTIEQLGTIGMVIYLVYGIGKFVSGMLADKCNIRVFMATGLFASSIINLLFAFLPQITAYVPVSLVFLASLLWGLNGAAQSMGFPPVAKGLVYWFSPSERATKWTLWSSSHTFGAFFVAQLISLLAWLKCGWQMSFIVPAIMGILYSLFMLYYMTDKPGCVGLPPIEVYRKDTVAPVKSKVGMTRWEIIVTYVLKNPFLWALAISYIFIYYVRFATLDWATTFLVQDRGFDMKLAASAASAMPFLGMPGGIVAGYLADKWFGGRCTQINLIYLAILAASCWGFYKIASVNAFWMTAVFAALIGFFVDGPQNLAGGVQATRVTVQDAASAACGLTGMCGYFGAMLASKGAAYISAHHGGWRGVYVSCIIACVIAGLCIATTWKKEQTPTKLRIKVSGKRKMRRAYLKFERFVFPNDKKKKQK